MLQSQKNCQLLTNMMQTFLRAQMIPSTLNAIQRRCLFIGSVGTSTNLPINKNFALNMIRSMTQDAPVPQKQMEQPCFSEVSAIKLVRNLNKDEREVLRKVITRYEESIIKKTLEDKLAASTWRTRFGRLSKVNSLGEVDATGTYCALPQDWVEKKLVESAPKPSHNDLFKIFFVNACPFIVFGFLDNFTMICAGEYIEHYVGYFMNISTMAAAGLGNTISDVMGLSSAVYVERLCFFLGIKQPNLTPAQFLMASSKRASNWGRILGIICGCFLGMTPLLFTDKSDED